jgi:hypothetical protein
VTGLPLADAVPLAPDRDTAREAARAELADPAYQAHEPSLWERAASWLWDKISDALSAAGSGVMGGPWAYLALAGIVVVGALLLRARLGPMAATSRRRAGELFGDAARTAADHQRAADAALAAGDLSGAVQERFRALVRGLEERGLVAARAGYTADEAAEESARVLPGCAQALRAAARAFDDVRYGGRPGTVEGHARVAAAEAAVRAARPTLAAADGNGAGPQGPPAGRPA